jgi:hypothetical protein
MPPRPCCRSSGVTLDEAWIEFTRWNAETGSYAAPGHYPEAARLAEATRESVHVGLGTVTTSIEGLSARYLALLVEEDAEITVTAARGVAASVRLADGPTGAELVIDAAESTDEFAVAEAHTVVARPRCDGAPCAVTLELVLSGVTPLTLPADVEVVVRAAPPPAADDDVGGGCCQASGPGDGAAGGTLALLVSALIGAPRRRRRAPRAAQPW